MRVHAIIRFPMKDSPPHERLTRRGLELKCLNAEGAGELVQESGDGFVIAIELGLGLRALEDRHQEARLGKLVEVPVVQSQGDDDDDDDDDDVGRNGGGKGPEKWP
jgi:hypothetical protein